MTAIFLVLVALWVCVNVGAMLLIGWLGVLTVNLILATSYPWYIGSMVLVVGWLLSGWVRWKRG